MGNDSNVGPVAILFIRIIILLASLDKEGKQHTCVSTSYTEYLYSVRYGLHGHILLPRVYRHIDSSIQILKQESKLPGVFSFRSQGQAVSSAVRPTLLHHILVRPCCQRNECYIAID